MPTTTIFSLYNVYVLLLVHVTVLCIKMRSKELNLECQGQVGNIINGVELQCLLMYKYHILYVLYMH